MSKKSGLFYECKLLPTSIMEYRSLNQIFAESLKSTIIIYAPFFDTNITFPEINELDNLKDTNATIISVGNFKQGNNKRMQQEKFI